MEHLRNLLAGMRRVLVLEGGRDYVRPQGGFARDRAALAGDARRVGENLRRAVARHGQQADDRTR